MEDVSLIFEDGSLAAIAAQALERRTSFSHLEQQEHASSAAGLTHFPSSSYPGTGARGLRSILEKLLMDAMLHVPGSNYGEVRVTSEAVETAGALTYVERVNKPKGGDEAQTTPPAASSEEEEEEDEPVARTA
jgi:ATP-dependent protease Clp ATPase subunit